MSQLDQVVRETVSHYIKEFDNTTNLLGITSVRNIIYILTDLENKVGFQINDSFIHEIKNLTVENLAKVIPEYLK
ncbi:hypothetical protein BVG16_29800 [Paenibacillus selenitireducens]|uniref:Carrier domain-containing protein n=1 Tax=Paenibacillus selenitireducens TaxID=1324314 RepID=A0A1T2X0D4_9BACL|nr:hypothetical protein [Paenibacillus selenitireducens]OPA73275.1 hypothetical protein BVG16_29800 [Paenibacillus selenitireducens]